MIKKRSTKHLACRFKTLNKKPFRPSASRLNVHTSFGQSQCIGFAEPQHIGVAECIAIPCAVRQSITQWCVAVRRLSEGSLPVLGCWLHYMLISGEAIRLCKLNMQT